MDGSTTAGFTEPYNPGSDSRKVLIIGVGLMGGSLGLALIERQAGFEVVGIDSPDVLAEAISIGALHRAGQSLAVETAAADLIVIATPVHSVVQVLTEIAPHVRSSAVVTDVASVKASIAVAGQSLLGDRFIGGHPMAGSEQTGIKAARSTLYLGAAWAFTPLSAVDPVPAGCTMLCELAARIGAVPLVTDPISHDEAAALISHLPHLICFGYNHAVETHQMSALAHSMAAGSYRDLTRVVASDPVLWRDVFLENQDAILEALQAFRESIGSLETAIKSGNSDTVLTAILTASGGLNECIQEK